MDAASQGNVQRFSVLASAIAGRAVGVERPSQGGPTWTDGATIFVDPDRVRSPLVCVAVQAALLGSGSLEPASLERIARNSGLAQRYLAIEGHRALAALDYLIPLSARRMINREIADLSASASQSLEIAVRRGPLPVPPEEFGVIRPRAVRQIAVQGEVAGLVPNAHQPRSQGRDILRELDDDEDEALAGPDMLSSPIGGGGALGRLLKMLFRSSRSSGGGSPGADAASHWSRRGGQVARVAATSPVRTPSAAEGHGLAPGKTTYPEWDVHQGRYRAEWCTVMSVDPTPADVAFTMPDILSVRRPLSHLGIALERRHRQLQGIDIDLDAAIEAHVQKLAGSVPDEAVYLDMVRSRRDLGVLVLLDVSGSSAEPATIGGSVFEHQRKAALALTVGLHDLGDRVALYAFRSQGRAAVQVERLKRFDDTLDASVLRRLAGCEPGAYTRLGTAIRHATSLLAQESGVSRRLLVVLSDGFAYDHGYEGTYGEADARRALSEARRLGTGCVCLSIGASTDAATLRRVFGTAAHASVGRFEELPRVVAPLFRFALRSADAQRRIFQHTTRSRELLDLERRRVA
ncbi:MAG TPA: VWA domain-containing protein [Acidimicrobiales bacterium]